MHTDGDFTGLVLVAAQGAGIAWALAFLINLIFVAPFKAYRRLVKPLKVSVSKAVSAPGSLSNRIFVAQNATLLIKNRSDVDMLDCSLVLLGIQGTDESKFPRLIQKFDIPAGRTRQVPVFYWTAREAPYQDDDVIQVCEPVQAGFYTGLRLSAGEHQAMLELTALDVEPQRMTFRCWLDKEARRLKGSLAPRDLAYAFGEKSVNE